MAAYAMELRADTRIAFARPLVFSAYRDKLSDLVDYLPNIRRIEVKERKEDGPVVELVNVWHGGGDVPAVARAFLSEAMLAWTDTVRWDETAFTADWHVKTHAFPEAVVCRGKNSFVESGDHTVFQLRGDLTIDASKLKGVPRLLSGSVAKAVEEFLVKKIGPNMVEVAQGVAKYLEAQKGR
jgi:hypothetical protein